VTNVEGFEWDDGNVSKVELRATLEEVESLLESRYVLVKNKRRRAGVLKLIGRAYNGRLLTVILAPTSSPATWRPVNAWDSDSEEIRAAQNARVI